MICVTLLFYPLLCMVCCDFEKKKLVRMSVLCIVIVHRCFVCVCLFGDFVVGALWRMSLSYSCV